MRISSLNSLLAILMLTMSFGTVAAQTNQWKLVWSDEFNYQGLPDPAKWNYEEGFKRNTESQYYTKARLENARVEDGHLVIECRQEQYTPVNHAPVKYTAASLTTKDLASYQYGRIEMRAKLPQGQGVWPAFWALGTNQSDVHWPVCGEIDIMEYVGKEPDVIHGTLHFSAAGKHVAAKGSLGLPTSPSEDFHVYGCEWTPERIVFFVDQTNYQTNFLDQAGQGEDNAFHKPFYLLLNFALGGAWGGPIDDAVLPQKFLVDYVRVYQAAAYPETRLAAGAKKSPTFAKWEKEIAAYERADAQNPPPVAGVEFVGSSTIKKWKTLAQDFPDQPVFNRGFGGSQIVDTTHFANRIIFPYAPRLIFFHAGDNDLASGKSPEQVFSDFKELISAIETRMPETDVVFISLKPSLSRWKLHDEELAVNQMIQDYSRNKPHLKFVDSYSLAVGADGKPRPELFAEDRLHLNAAGYKLLANQVRPLLNKSN